MNKVEKIQNEHEKKAQVVISNLLANREQYYNAEKKYKEQLENLNSSITSAREVLNNYNKADLTTIASQIMIDLQKTLDQTQKYLDDSIKQVVPKIESKSIKHIFGTNIKNKINNRK